MYFNISKKQQGFILALIVVLIWSINIVITRYSVEFISPVSISFYRWMIAFLIFTPFVCHKIRPMWFAIKPHLLKLMVLSALGMAMTQGLAYVAAQHTTATNMGIINAFVPIMTIFISYLILGEIPSKFALFGGILSVFGLLYIINEGNLGYLFLNHTSWTGDTLMFISISFYATYCVLLKKWNIELPLSLSLYIQIFVAMVYHIPFILVLGLDHITVENIQIFAYAGIFTSLIGPFLWVTAINKIGPTKTSAAMNFIPVFTAVIATSFLSEQWSIYHTIGGSLILIGTLMTQRKNAKLVYAKP